MIFLQWTVFYLAPALGTIFFASKQRLPRNGLLLIHAGLVVSVALLSTTGTRLSWGFQNYALIVALITVLLSVYLLRWVGIGYIVSSAIQEWCLLLAGVLLASTSGIFISAGATALVYALAHVVDSSGWRWKLPCTFFWGVASIFLYAWLRQPILNIALHAVVGVVLIRSGLLYQNSFNRSRPRDLMW